MDNKGGVNDDEQEGQPSAFQCFPSSKHDHRLSAPAPFSSPPVSSRQLNNAPRVALTERVHSTNHSEDFQRGKTACAITDPVGPRLQANVRSLSSEVILDNWSMNDISSQNIFRNVMNYCDPKFPPPRHTSQRFNASAWASCLRSEVATKSYRQCFSTFWGGRLLVHRQIRNVD